jgi:hypothetical protein
VKILLFSGAGASMELGVPGMIGMGEQFLDYSKQWNVEPDLVQKIMGSSMDVEYLIDALDCICTARSPLETIGQENVSFDRVDKIRAEVEWFVQHVAERVVGKDAQLMWGSVLRVATSEKLILVTTNYDRAIELAANAENVSLDDGFVDFNQGEAASWLGFGQAPGRPLLIKLHGSTNWYEDRMSNSPIKLRHPMPLFARATLRLIEGQELGSALVLPSREKLLMHAPYPRLSQAFLNASDSCDIAIFVGSSLRDHHIRDAAQTTACRVPLFVVNPDGDSFGLEHVKTIKQYASTFLIATLPSALRSSNTEEALKVLTDQHHHDRPILNAVRQALDTNSPTNARCQALEELDEAGIMLDSFLLRELLAAEDPSVARYSLGLLSLSATRDALIEEAANTQHAKDPAFQEDLRLLREMVFREA